MYKTLMRYYNMKQRIYYTDPNGNSYTTFTNKLLYINSVGSSVLESDSLSGYKKSRNYYRLFYLYYGDVSIKTDKKKITLKSGQLIIFPPDTPFTYKKNNKSKMEYLWLNFTGTQAKALVDSVFLPIGTPVNVSIPEYIFEAFETLYAEYEERTSFFEPAMMYKLMHIMVILGRGAEKTNRTSNDGSLFTSLSYINNNYADDITTEKLAAMEHLSVSHFRRLFKHKTGMTPTQYLTNARLNIAGQLLLQTDKNINQISAMVGFDNQLYFSKLFSKHFGKSPKTYRQERNKTKNKKSKT